MKQIRYVALVLFFCAVSYPYASYAEESKNLPTQPFISDEHTIGLWHMDEGKGEIVADASSNGINGKIIEVSGYNWAGGKFGQALKFEGKKNNYVDLGEVLPLSLKGSFTLEAWIKTDYSGSSAMGIVGKWNSGLPVDPDQPGDESQSYALFITPEKNLALVVDLPNNDNAMAVSRKTVNDGQWHHVAGIYDGSFIKVFIDGTEDGIPTAVTEYTGSIASATIGLVDERAGRPAAFSGVIDEVRISDIARYSDEMVY